jgi:hypothetical protein
MKKKRVKEIDSGEIVSRFVGEGMYVRVPVCHRCNV